MKLVAYEADGQIRHGLLQESSIVDLGLGDLGVALARGLPDDVDDRTTPTRRLADVRLRAPIARPGKFIAVAANYQEHVREGGGVPVERAASVPRLFLKPTTSILGPDDPLVLPSVSHTVDWEVELGVVIGSTARDLSVHQALDAVFGYTVINDVSARSLDLTAAPRDLSGWPGFFDWLMGKWIDGFGPMGPLIVTKDEIADPQNVALSLSVSGRVHQDGNSSDMIFTVAELVSFASRLMTLEPGDVIATGTPAGVGATTGTYLGDGDVMEATVQGVGVLRTPVVARQRADVVSV